MIRENTVLKIFPLYCPKCKKETIINVQNRKITLASSGDVQNLVHEIIGFVQKHASINLIGNDYCNTIINAYSSTYVKTITDKKHGVGAADYIVNAFQYYADHN